MKKVLWLDTETTGLNPKVHGLREVAFIVEVDGVEREKGVFKINPFTYTSKKVEINDYALSISGVTIKDLEAYDRSSYCFKEFCNILTKYVNTDDKNDVFMIAGFNVSFDVGFIKDWFREIGLYDSYKDLFHYKNLDVFPLVITLKHLGFIDTVDDKLKTVCKHFNIQIDAHNALSDIQATKNLYELISDRFINDKEAFKQREFDYRTECQNVVSAARLEADDIPDRLEKLEKVILDYYLDKGYQVGAGKWYFNVAISTCFKSKVLKVFFVEELSSNEVFETIQYTTKEMLDEAIKHFSLKTEPLQEDTKPELDDTNQSAIYKIAGYESDGRE